MKLLGYGWNYINEGNVHIVLQLTNTEHALRLIKEDGKPTPLLDVQNSTMFVNLVMTPLLNCKTNYQEIIHLPGEELSQLSQVLQDQRPENRRFKSKLSTFAIKTMNLTMLSPLCHANYCVEIKPKEGFLASSLKSLSRCYYCLNQYLKLDLHQIDKRSKYCPLDLFSGEQKRMKKALVNLISNPQNNFKIFKNGKIVFNENSEFHDVEDVVKSMSAFKSINQFLDFLIEALLSCNNRHTNLIETPEILQESTTSDNCLESAHLQECNDYKNLTLLHKLLRIQKLSDVLNIDFTSLGHGKEYVEKIIDKIQRGIDLNIEVDRELFYNLADPVHLAMISAVAKDCSIMISFSTEYVENYPYIYVDSKTIPYRVSITDLEPKNVESLLRRKKTESKIIDAFKKYLNRKIAEDI